MAAIQMSMTSMIIFIGLCTVAPWILWAVQANASFTGNCITLAVLITELFDLDIENEKLTFSISVPPGYFFDIPGFFLLLSFPNDSTSNLMISFEMLFFSSSITPIRSPLAHWCSNYKLAILLLQSWFSIPSDMECCLYFQHYLYED